MKIFILDTDGVGLNMALRAQDAGHDVRLYQNPFHGGRLNPAGQGLVKKVNAWRPSMGWADLILLTNNAKYQDDLSLFYNQRYPIIGANKASAELELDRGVGQRVLEDHGIEVLPYTVCEGYTEALNYVRTQTDGVACKPWGGLDDKSLTFVAADADEAEFMLGHWKSLGIKIGKLMFQKKCDGPEMAVSAWVGPHGFNKAINESWEHKKHLAGDLGCNTGEQGTVVRYVTKSTLFNRVLKPLEDHLVGLGYVGNVDVNCRIDENTGTPYPLEFTMRFGWPAQNILMTLHEGDPFDWLRDLWEGKDTLKVKRELAVGVVMTHGQYPFVGNRTDDEGFPVRGVTPENYPFIAWTSVMAGDAPKNGARKPALVTAGDYVCVATGHGTRVSEANKAALSVADEIKWPSNRGYRRDIGARLKKELPILQGLGFATNMEW
jgi:phosphoribosylamine--glycine ligase